MSKDVKLNAEESADTGAAEVSQGEQVWLEVDSDGNVFQFNEAVMNAHADAGDQTAVSIRALLELDRKGR